MAGWTVGLLGGAAEGYVDGWTIAADVLTFEAITPLHDYAQEKYEGGDWTYAASKAFSILARTALSIVVLNPVVTYVAGLGAAGQAVVYGFAGYGVYKSVQQLGHGIGKVMEGDQEGWWDIYEGGLNLATVFLVVKPAGKPGRLLTLPTNR